MKVLGSVLFLLLLTSCGICDCDKVDSGGVITPPGGVDAFATDIKPILDKGCAGSGCHQSGQGFMASGTALKASAAATRVTNGSMPIANSAQSKVFTAADKTKLLEYLAK